MNNLANHLKKYGAIYLIIVASLIIGLIIFLKPNKEEPEEETYDTSFFTEVDTAGAVNLFESNASSVLLICRPGCAVCQQFVPYLQIAMVQYGFEVNYLNLDTIDQNSEEYQKLAEKLDYEYTLDGKTAPFSQFMGATPMFIIIKNHRMVFGHLGIEMNDTIGSYVTQYGMNTK